MGNANHGMTLSTIAKVGNFDQFLREMERYLSAKKEMTGRSVFHLQKQKRIASFPIDEQNDVTRRRMGRGR